jgi:hypothetical protein
MQAAAGADNGRSSVRMIRGGVGVSAPRWSAVARAAAASRGAGTCPGCCDDTWPLLGRNPPGRRYDQGAEGCGETGRGGGITWVSEPVSGSLGAILAPGKAVRRLGESRVQPVATRFRDQDLTVPWVDFHLLPKAVDVGFQGVSGHAAVVAPHLLQQDWTRHRLRACAI